MKKLFRFFSLYFGLTLVTPKEISDLEFNLSHIRKQINKNLMNGKNNFLLHSSVYFAIKDELEKDGWKVETTITRPSFDFREIFIR